MTYQVVKKGLIFTVRSEAEASRYAQEGCTVAAIMEMVLKDGKLQTIEEANVATGVGEGSSPPSDPLATGRAGSEEGGKNG